MFSAIIQQAFHDVFAPSNNTYGDKELVRAEAISFLTSSTGEWNAHRRFLCDLIGLDSDVLRLYVHNILMGHRDPTLKMPGVEKNGQEAFKQSQVDAARAVYQRQHQKNPKPVVAKPAEPTDTANPIPFPRIKPQPIPKESKLMQSWLANMAGA